MRDLLIKSLSAQKFLVKVGPLLLGSLILMLAPYLTSAHEVYVLDSATVQHILESPSPNPFSVLDTHRTQFFIWTFIAIMTVGIVFLVSIFRPLEERFGPMLFNIKRKGSFIIIRITIGLSLFASGYYHALFGPELPLAEFYRSFSPYAAVVLMIAGVCIVIGLFTRIMGITALLIVLYGLVKGGTYLLTYSNYIGDIFVVGILGAHVWSIDKHVLKWHGLLGRIERFVEKYAFLILRVTFGVSLIYASVYAKFIHSNLALETVLQYHLTDYFHFEPMFIVLGACLIEITIGTFIIIGFEVRFASLFLMFFLTLSLLYFGEAVWPHIVLFGGALSLFVHGYDRYTIEGYFFKNAKHEPLL